MLKVTSPVEGSRRNAFVFECPMLDWSARDMVKKLGPGVYHLAPGPGPYRQKSATLEVSEVYARQCEWGATPPHAVQRPSEMMAQGLMQRAQAQGVPEGNLAFIMETVIRPLVEEVRAMRQQPAQPAAPGVDFANMLAVLSTIQANAQAQSKDMMALVFGAMQGKLPNFATGGEDDAGDEKGMISAATEGLGRGAASVLLDLLKPKPAPVQMPQPIVQTLPHRGPMPVIAPIPNPTRPATVTEFTSGGTTMLSPEEVLALKPFTDAVRPFVGLLRGMEGQEPAAVAATLDNRISSEEEALAVVFLDHKVKEKGISVLGVIHPELASPFWAAVVNQLAERCRQALPVEGEEGVLEG